ncbi:heparinase II/III family protein [Cloacibacillus porcorum]|uniref:heparinase II/III domain-containing protein n=1 Tax=Cloacibacillus porcorum TaxID=1197717 RepID=UPI0023F2A06F|nr:heparinase II/III family protein [Cloacibacillus porcorum]MDD7647997.1 heparinase II/III family protein [Cloacibacillus porcorum]MDY4093469.1 heparinase II/III family protein [Cloacibacillus porcorum]
MKNILLLVIKEYGACWLLNRSLYSLKLKSLRLLPFAERFFEHNVAVSRIDIFEIKTDAIKDFLKRLPIEKQKEIISRADNALSGVLFAFSCHNFDYKNPIDWHYSPVTKMSSPKDSKWYKLSDFDPNRGDIKVIWEASRFTHGYCLVRAFLLTGDVKYFEAFAAHVKSWLKDNSYSYGINYKCGQECAIRMINILIVYSAFKEAGMASSELENNVGTIVKDSYKKILSNFFYARRCIKNNHTISEITGQIIGAWCCEDDKKVAEMYALLEETISDQFYADGGYKQFSSNYQRLVLQLMECLFSIAPKTGHYLSKKANEIIKNSAQLLFMMQNEDGYVPNYGSNDGALIFPVASQDYRDYRPVINTVYAVAAGNRLYKAGDYDEELLWFVGKTDFPITAPERKSVSYDMSGYYILRSGESFLVTYLQNYKSRPGHMDQLHMDLWYKGVNIFCDGGTYSYADASGKSLARTASHNVLMINDLDQMDSDGAFLIYNWTKRTKFNMNDKYFSGTLSARNGSYFHKRNIKIEENGYVIFDSVETDIEGEATMLFHSPCNIEVRENRFRVIHNNKYLCDVQVNGDISLCSSHMSSHYYELEEISCVMVKQKITDRKCVFETHINFIDSDKENNG